MKSQPVSKRILAVIKDDLKKHSRAHVAAAIGITDDTLQRLTKKGNCAATTIAKLDRYLKDHELTAMHRERQTKFREKQKRNERVMQGEALSLVLTVPATLATPLLLRAIAEDRTPKQILNAIIAEGLED